MNKITNSVINNSVFIEKAMFWTLLSSLFVLLLIYGFLFNSMMKSAFSIENIQSEISSTNDEIAGLEYSYMELQKGITSELALSKGFFSPRKPIFLNIDSSKDFSLRTSVER